MEIDDKIREAKERFVGEYIGENWLVGQREKRGKLNELRTIFGKRKIKNNMRIEGVKNKRKFLTRDLIFLIFLKAFNFSSLNNQS